MASAIDLLEGKEPLVQSSAADVLIGKAGLPKTDYDDLITSASEEHGVPYEVLYRTLKRESNFNPKAVPIDPKTKKPLSSAKGMAQFIDSTAKAMGIKDPFDPKQAIPGAGKYLKHLYDQFGDWKLAVAAYNQGPGAVRKAKGIPKEAAGYVKDIFPDDDNEPTYQELEETSEGGRFKSAMSLLDEVKAPVQKPLASVPTEIKATTPSDSSRRFYSEKVTYNPIIGLWHPEMGAAMARRGYGPKVSINEFGVPVDEKGQEIYKQGVNDKEARPSAFGKEMVISEDKSKPSFVKRALTSVADLLGIEVEPKLSEAAKAQAVVKLMADEAGVPVGQYRVAPEFIEQAASSFVNSASFGIIPAIRKEMTGEEDFEVSSTPGHVGQALGSLGGLMLGPFKVGEGVMSPLLRVMPRATQEGKIAGRILKESLHDAVVLSAGMGLAATGEALEKTTFGQAAEAIGKAAGSGAMTGAIFGTARGLFPAEGIETGTRLITGLIGLNAYRAIEVGGNPFTNRPVGDVVFDTALDALFLYRGLPRAITREVVKEVEDINKSYDRIKKVEEIAKEAPPDVQAQINTQALEVEKTRLRNKYDQFVRKIGGDVELVHEYGMLAENLAKEHMRPIESSRPEMAEDYVAKPVKLTKKEQAKIDKAKEKGEVAKKEVEKVKAEKPADVTKDSLQEQIDSNPELAGKIRVDALGEEGTTLLPGNVQVTILEAGKESSFTAKADIGDIVDRYKNKIGEYEAAEKRKGTTVITRKKSGEPVKKFKELEEPKVEAEETMSPELLRHLDSMIEEAETIVEKPKKGKVEDKKAIDEKVDYFGEREVITEVDKATGNDLPSDVVNDSFMKSKEDTMNLHRIFEERQKSVAESPEMYVQKLINDVRRWKHGEDVDIKAVRDALSQMASRANELRDYFDTGVDHIQFMDVAKEAAKWARNTGRAKPKVGGGVRLNVMIPLDQIPESVKFFFKYIKGASGKVRASEVYRNKDLWKGTGFWLGRDGKWRYEIDDSKAKYFVPEYLREYMVKYGETSAKLGEVLSYDELYKAIPEAKNIVVEYDRNFSMKGAYDPIEKSITIKNMGDKKTLFHELSHMINDSVGAFLGGNPGGILVERTRSIIKDLKKVAKTDEVLKEISHVEKQFNKGNIGTNEAAELLLYIVERRAPKSADKFAEKLNEILDAGSAFDEYRMIPGEMESRLTERRLNMSKEARMSEPPWQTLDRMLAQEGINPEVGRKLYSGVPFDQMAKLVKKNWKQLREDQTMFRDQIKGWLMGFRKDMPEPDSIYRGVYKGSKVRSSEELQHGTPWAYEAARGGKGGFGDPSSHDVYEIPASKDTKYYRGGSLAGDPLERTRIDSSKGMTWEEVMNKAKELYYQDLAKLRAQEKKNGREVTASDEMYLADRVASDIRNATFETDMEGQKGIWSEFGPDRDLARDYPKLRHIDTVRAVAEAKRRAGYTDAQIPELKILGEVSKTKFYSGLPVDEAAKAIVAGAKKVAEYTTKARGMKKFKPGAAFQRAREEFVRSAIDRSGNIKQDMLDVLGDDGYKIVQKMVLAKGASARSVKELKQMRSEVYDGLSAREKKILDDIILDDRMIDIAKYKNESEFKFPKGISIKDFIAHRTLFGETEKLSQKQVEKLNARATAYFEWMKKPLKDMLDSGLISQTEYNDLVSHNYRKIKLVEIFDKRYTAKVGKRTRTVYDSGIEALARGRETDIYEPSSEIMALEVFNRAYGRILNNEANKSLLDLAQKDPTNPFVRIKSDKPKSQQGPEDKIPTGWHRIFVFDKGEKKSLWVSPEMGKEWIINSPEISYKMGQVLRWASGSPVLRTFATGINWGFAVANIPRDVMHAWFTARRFENGEWKSLYSPHLPVFAAQIGRDLGGVFTDAALRRGRYNDYIDQGGGMEFLVHQGRLLQRGRHIDSKIGDVLDFMGYFGETGEVLTRLAIRERVLRKEAKKRGISIEEARKDKSLSEEATFAARDYMDFGQGGGITKAADNALPYLNAAIQGSRGMVRAFKPGGGQALSSTYKMGQFASVVVGTYIAANALAPKTMENMKGNIDAQNNLVVPLGDEFSFVDEDGQTRYIYFKIPLDPSQKFFKTFFEGATDKWLGNEVDVDRITGTLNDQSPVGVSQLPPTISATLGYMSNKDFWLNEDIWKQTDKPFPFPQSREEFTKNTPQAYVDLGKVTGLSPERTKYAVEELVTNGTIWSYLVGQGYDAAFGDIHKDKKEQHLAMALARFPGIKRFIGVTNPYSKHASKIEDAQQESVVKRFVENRNMDIYIDAYLKGEGGVKREEVIQHAASYKDKKTYDRLIDRFKWEEAIKDLPEKSFWKRMKGLPTDAKAKIFVDRLNKADEGERRKLMEEYSIVAKAGGVVSKEFRHEVSKLMGSE